MTKEIAQYCMKAYSQYHNEMCEECPIYGQTGDDHCFEDALQYVINHFDVLDKIRAEIEQIIGEHNLDDYDFCSGLICARKIIDKYRAGSEDKDMYKAYRFDSIYDLKDFLNDNEIKPTDIIGIYREHKYQDQGCFDLLYVRPQERSDKECTKKI